MNDALDYLNTLVEQGTEFPDAAFTTAQKFQVNQSELEVEYDYQFGDM